MSNAEVNEKYFEEEKAELLDEIARLRQDISDIGASRLVMNMEGLRAENERLRAEHKQISARWNEALDREAKLRDEVARLKDRR